MAPALFRFDDIVVGFVHMFVRDFADRPDKARPNGASVHGGIQFGRTFILRQSRAFKLNATRAAYLQENQQLQDLQQRLEEYIRENNLQDELSTELQEEGLMIRIKEKALFPSGSADLVPESQRIGPIVAGLLAEVPERVLISGHTDTDPINTAQFPSNWELSSTRALTFMKYLLSINQNLNPARFSAIGYGEYRPIAMNDTDENKQKNRRVEILIARSLTFNPNEGFKAQTDADLVAK